MTRMLFQRHTVAHALVPADKAAREMLEELPPGRKVALMEAERSDRSHKSEFAFVRRAFKNLPEGDTRFANPEALRKWCLIKRGWCDHRVVACASEADAQAVAALVGQYDPYAIVTITDDVVLVATAHSQSLKAMGKADWERSKQDVLEECAALIGVTPEELMRG